MEKPFIAEDLLKQEDVTEKEVGGPSNVGTFVVSEEVARHTLETIEEEDQHALDATEFISTSNHLDSILDNTLNSPNSTLMTKSPTITTPQSPKPSSEHTHSPKHDHNLYMGHVASSP